MFVPEELSSIDVSAPGEFQWALTTENKRPLLTSISPRASKATCRC